MQKRMRKKEAALPLEPARCNCLALRQAARHVTQLYDGLLAAEGLTSAQYSILARLARLGPQSMNLLAAGLVMDRTTLTRALRPLTRDGLVAIAAGDDERVRVARLTPTGAARVKAAASRWRAAQQKFESAVGAAEAERLRDALARVVQAL